MKTITVFLFSVALASVACKSTTVVPLRPDDDTNFLSFDGDTLKFYTSADFVYEPFGSIATPSDIRRSLPEWFSVDSISRDGHTFYLLGSPQAQFMIYVEQDSEATRSSYIQAGSLTTPMLAVSPGIRIGVKLHELLGAHFSSYPSSWNSAKVVEFGAAVSSDFQTYVFQNDTLASVTFNCRGCNPTFKL